MSYGETLPCSPEIWVLQEEVDFSVLSSCLLYSNAGNYVLVAATHFKTCEYVHDSQLQLVTGIIETKTY